MEKLKKPKHTKDYYLQKKKFLSSCTDAFGVMSIIALFMILTGTFDTLFPFGARGLYFIFFLDTLCIIGKWSYYKKALKAVRYEKESLKGSKEE